MPKTDFIGREEGRRFCGSSASLTISVLSSSLTPFCPDSALETVTVLTFNLGIIIGLLLTRGIICTIVMRLCLRIKRRLW